MPIDKFSAVWVSHSSISDFLACPRAYFLKNVYKNPKTGRKMTLMSPALALGQAVHEVVESLSILPVEKRFQTPLFAKFEKAWRRVTGKKGGFMSQDQEDKYFQRGKAMLERATAHPGPLAKKAVKLSTDLPQFWLSQDDGIMLCGKIDWIQYVEDTNSVRIVDFKTSKVEESAESLQLPIYHLLAHYCQKRPVVGVSYWYLELSDELIEKPLPDLQASQDHILKIAKQMKLARALERFKCPEGDDGCRHCKPFEAILRGEAEYVGSDTTRRDVYVMKVVKDMTLSGGDEREDGTIL